MSVEKTGMESKEVPKSVSLDKLQTLVDINARINSNYSDLNALLVYILEAAMCLVECESSSLLLVNKEDDSLRFVVALGPKGAEAKNIPVDMNSIAGWVVQSNKPLIVNDVASDLRFNSEVQKKTGYVTRTMVAIPMRIKGQCIGVIELINKTKTRGFDDSDLQVLTLLAEQAAIAYTNAHSYQSAQDKISVLSARIKNGASYHSFVAKNAAVLNLLHVVEQVAVTNSSVLITGESGVGKELFAEQLHLKSPRAEKAFVRVNCAALSPALLESELFGHVRGAFTDAVQDRKGRFEMADGGTLFLDEIGELPLDLQAKLLRVIQSRSFERVGSSETITVDVRIIAATNRNLEQMVQDGDFRSDLFYRLNVLPINIPPLRERKEDIEPLASYFLQKFAAETKKNFTGFSQTAMRTLFDYYWPGNIRELENCIERSCVFGTPPVIQAVDLGITSAPENITTVDSALATDYETLADDIASSGEDKTLKTAVNAFKRAYVIKILNETAWNQTKAGKILGIQRTYVSRLLNELHIR